MDLRGLFIGAAYGPLLLIHSVLSSVHREGWGCEEQLPCPKQHRGAVALLRMYQVYETLRAYTELNEQGWFAKLTCLSGL